MNIKTVLDLLNYVETEEKAYKLIDYISNLENQLQQKENIIKEVREYIYNKEINTLHFNSKDFLDTSIAKELLEILDKDSDKE